MQVVRALVREQALVPEQASPVQESLPAGLVQVQVLAPESELPGV